MTSISPPIPAPAHTVEAVQPRRRVWFILTANATVFLLAFAALEAYVRVSRPYVNLWGLTGRDKPPPAPSPLKQWADVDAFSAYRPRPGQYANRRDKTVNSLGYFSTLEIEMPKPAGRTRIIFLGSSATAGTGSDPPLADEETWPWNTIDFIRDDLPHADVDFINAAVPGYTSFESYGRLWSRSRFLNPDIVVVFHGWAEMNYFQRPILSWRTLPDGSWTLDRQAQAVSGFEPMWFDHLIKPSQFLTRMRVRLSTASNAPERSKRSRTLAQTFNHQGLTIWRDNLRILRATTEALGMELFVCKPATLIVQDLPLEQRERCRYEYHGFDHDAHVEAFRQINRVIDEEIRPDRIIDTAALSGQPDYFYDHGHPTVRGSTEIARVVADALIVHLAERFAREGR